MRRAETLGNTSVGRWDYNWVEIFFGKSKSSYIYIEKLKNRPAW